MKHTINAQGKKLGRVATEVAVLLMGKDSSDFASNKVSGNTVKVINASSLDINEKKKKNTIYKHYTGYPGGLREETMQKIIDKKGYSEIFKKAVYGMLPGNKLRSKMMANLRVEE